VFDKALLHAMTTLNDLFCNILGESGSRESQELLTLKNKILREQYQLNLFDYAELEEESDTLIEFDHTEICYPGTYDNTIIRRIYLKDGSYHCGWVVDSDVSACMSCGEDFMLNIFGKHHCRACGNIVCSECSPYVADVQPLHEVGGSRICRDCFRTMLQDIDDALRHPNMNESCLDFAAIYDLTTPATGNFKSMNDTKDDHTLFHHSTEQLQRVATRQSSYQTFASGDSDITYEVNPLRSSMKTTSDVQSEGDLKQMSSSSDSNSASHEKKEEMDSESPHLLPKIEIVDDFGSTSEFNTPLPSRRALPSNFMMRSPNGSVATTRSMGSVLSRARFQFNQSFNSPTAAPKIAQEFKRLILAGDAGKARSLLRFGCEPPSPAVATKYLRTCLKDIDVLQEVLGTAEILVEQCGADYNDLDQDGVSILELVMLTDNDIVGDYLIAQGADCLRENHKGDCILSRSFELGRSWVYEKFQQYQEEELLKSSKYDRIEVYIKCLMFAGHIPAVANLIDSKQIFIGPEEAMDLYRHCLTAPDRLKDPDLALDFLRRLGATIDDDYENDDDTLAVDESSGEKTSDGQASVEEFKGSAWEAAIEVEGNLVTRESPSAKLAATNKANLNESNDSELEDDWSVIENSSLVGPVSIEDVTYI
jgi:hypothetical protein